MRILRNVLFNMIAIGIALSAGPESFAQTGPSNLNVSGFLFQSNGQPVTGNVNFKIEIYDKNSTCVLYAEDHNAQDLTASKGGFSIQIGEGSSKSNKIDAGSATALSSKVFQNTGAIAPYAGCAGGVNLNAGDNRMLRVWYNTGSGMTAMTPDVPMSSAAFSMVADTLQGKTPSNFVQVRDDATYDLNQANVESIFSAANFAKLTAILSGNASNQRLTNVVDPTAASDAATKGYADANVGGKVGDFTGVGPATGNGKTLIWDQAQNKWVTGVPTATDATKLPLAGGTMTGAIAMGGQNITNIGHMTMATQKTLNLGTYTTAQETTLIATPLTAADKGKIWFNSTTNKMMVWDGSAAVDYSAAAGAAGGDLTGTYPNPTIANGKVLTAAIANDAVTSAKINNTGIAVNRLLITDATTGGTVGYSVCAVGEVLKYGATGWACSTVASLLGNSGVTAATYGSATQVAQVAVDAQGRVTSASNVAITFPVVSVAGKTGVVTLNTGDLTNAGTAATKNFGTGANELVELDGTGKLPAVNGSALTNVNAVQIQSRNIAATAPAANEVLTWNNSTSVWEPKTLPAGPNSFVQNGNAFGGSAVLGTNDNNSLSFETNGSSRVTIDSSGNVGIGTTNPGWSIDAVGDGLRLLSGTPASNGSIINMFQMGSDSDSAFLWTIAEGNHTGTSRPTGIAFGTTAVGTTAVTSKFYISGSGNIGVGTSNPAATLDVTGVIRATDICDETGANCKDISSGWGAGGDIDGVYTTASTGLLGGFASGSGTLSIDTGVTTGKIIQVAASNKLPVIDGSNLTQINAVQLQSKNVSSAAPSADQVLTWNGTTSVWESRALPAGNPGDITSVVNGTGLTGGGTAGDVTLNVDVGTTTGKIVQMAASNKLPAVDGSNLTNIVAASVAAGAGTVGAPSISFSGDPNTGWWNPAADTLAASTNGAERVRIDSNGSVGIGTASPTAQLHVGGSGNGIARFDTSIYTPLVYSGSGGLMLGRISTETVLQAVDPGSAVRIRNQAGTTVMSLTDSGDVGIGTINPAVKLDVSGVIRATDICDETGANCKDLSGGWGAGGDIDGVYSGTGLTGGFASGSGTLAVDATAVFMQNGNSFAGTGVLGTNDNNKLSFETNNTVRMTLDTSGYLGIGTAVPSKKLHIVSTGGLNDGAYIKSTGSAAGDYSSYTLENDSSDIGQLFLTGSGYNLVPEIGSRSLGFYNNGTGGITLMADNASATMKFAVGGSGAVNEAMRILANRNVGIGTTNPAAKLDVAGIIRATDICDETGANCKDLSGGWGAGGDIDGVYTGTGLTGGFASGSGTLSVDVGTTTGKIVQMAASDKLPAVDGSNLLNLNLSGSNGFIQDGNSFGAAATLGTNDNFALNFEANNTKAMTILPNGNVGVGTAAPTAKLHLDSGATALSSDSNSIKITGVADNGGSPVNAVATIELGRANYNYEFGEALQFKYTSDDPANFIPQYQFVGSDSNHTVGIEDGNLFGYRFGYTDGRLSLQPVSSALPGLTIWSPTPTVSTEAFRLIPNGGASGLAMGHISDGTQTTSHYLASTSAPIEIRTAGSPRIWVASGGNVGIGTNNPAAKLDVAGIIRATDICDETGANCKDISAGWSGGGGGDFMANGSVPMTGNLSHTGGNFTISQANGNSITLGNGSSTTGTNIQGGAVWITANSSAADAINFQNLNAAGGVTITPGTTSGSVSIGTSSTGASTFGNTGSGAVTTIRGGTGGSGKVTITSAGTGANAIELKTTNFPGGITIAPESSSSFVAGGGSSTGSVTIGNASTGSATFGNTGSGAVTTLRSGSGGITITSAALSSTTAINMTTSDTGAGITIAPGSATGNLIVGSASSGTASFGNTGSGAINTLNGGAGAGKAVMSSAGTGTDAVLLSVSGTNGGIQLSPNGTGVVRSSAPLSIVRLASDPAGTGGYGTIYPKTDGKLYYRDGTGTITDLMGSKVTSVVAGTGLTGGNITSTGTLAVDVGTVTGKIVQMAASDKLPAVDGSSLTNVIASSVAAGAGTVGAPSISFSADSNTGWWNPSADVLAASTAGAERIRISATGNIGIGVTGGASNLLEIQTSSTSSPLRLSRSNNATNPANMIFQPAGALSASNVQWSAGIPYAAGYFDISTFDGTTVTSRVSIGTSGNVGIGTANPASKLDVAGIIRATDICDETGANCKDISGGWSSSPSFPLIATPIGTSGAPAYSFTGATNTGMFLNGTDLSFSRAGTEVLSIQAGNIYSYRDVVLFNAHLLEQGNSATVYSATGPNDYLDGIGPVAENASSTTGSNSLFGLNVKNAGGTVQRAYMTAISTAAGYTPNLAFNVSVGTSSRAERMRIDSSGNVGIGTTNPGVKLDVAGKIVAAQGLPGTAAGFSFNEASYDSGMFSTVNNQVEFHTGGVERLRIDSAAKTTAYGTLAVETGQPTLIFQNTSAAADNKTWFLTSSNASQLLTFQALNDASAGGGDLIQMRRSGNQISQMEFVGGGVVKNVIGTNGNSYFNVGNVGIGTTNPASKLDVNGVIRATDICDETGANCKDISTGWGGGGANPAGSGSEIQFRSNGTTFGANSNFVWDTTNSLLGIGTSSPVGMIDARKSGSVPFGFYTDFTNTASNATLIGSLNQMTNSYTGGTTSLMHGVKTFAITSGSTTTTNLFGEAVYAQSAGTVTNAYAGYFSAQTIGGTIGTGYGVYIDNTIATTSYGLYQSGATNKNYFAGTVGIGITNPAYKLDLNGPSTSSLTANTNYDLAGFREYTTGKGMVVGYRANAGGTAVDRSYIRTESGTNLALGTNAYPTALYINETNGNVGVGTTTPGQKLTVTGTVESTSGGFSSTEAGTGYVQLTGGAAPAAPPASTGNVFVNASGMLDCKYGAGSADCMPTSNTASAAVGANVTMTTANTYYDGPSTSLAAGTWMIQATVTLRTTSSTTNTPFTCKLWDGTTVVSSTEETSFAITTAAVRHVSINLQGIVSPGSTTTYKVSCTSTVASQILLAAATDNGAGNNASTIFAFRLK